MLRPFLAVLAFLATSAFALAQGADVALGVDSFDRAAPVEVTADTLSIDQEDGSAVFDGNVLVVQGDIRMSAALITVIYSTDENGNADGISELRATGGVTVVTPTDAAEAAEAVYSVASGLVTMSGDVLLTQGQTALSGEELELDLNSGTGRMVGRVRTIFSASQN